MRRILICECCLAQIGSFEESNLALPIKATMFDPLEAGFPLPFNPELGWDYLNCPVCHNRAMGWDEGVAAGVRMDRLLTDTGFLVVEPPTPETVVEVVEPMPTSVAKAKPGPKKGWKKHGR